MTEVDVRTQDVGDERPARDAIGPDRRAVGRRRLSIEVSPDLHRRILTICATRCIPVNQAVREVLERAFPGLPSGS